LERFADAFAPCGFRPEAFLPCYGLAEATLLVTGKRLTPRPKVISVPADALGSGKIEPEESGGPTLTLVGSGGVAEGLDVVIVDPETGAPCPADRVGEVWVRG